MEKVKLKDFIKKLEDARADFVSSFDREPHIWSIRVTDGEMELTDTLSKTPSGFSCKSSETYTIQKLSDL